MKITERILTVGTGCNQSVATAWLPAIQSACDKFEINTPKRLAALLANVGVESNGLTVFTENLNYSAQGLANTWPNRFSTGRKVPVAPNSPIARWEPNALANQLAHQPEAIANSVYASRMGNGDVASGDGWKYRGQGPIQITGRETILGFLASVDMPLNTDPSELCRPTLGALSVAWFFAKLKGCNAYADVNDFARVVSAINGAPPMAANQGPRRISLYNACLAAIGQET